MDDQGTDATGARGGPQPVRGKRAEVGFGGSGVANWGTIDAAPVSREQGRLLTASGVVRVCSGGVEEEVNSEDPDKDAERASAALIRGEDRAGQQATGGGIISEPHVDALTGSSQEAQDRGFEADRGIAVVMVLRMRRTTPDKTAAVMHGIDGMVPSTGRGTQHRGQRSNVAFGDGRKGRLRERIRLMGNWQARRRSRAAHGGRQGHGHGHGAAGEGQPGDSKTGCQRAHVRIRLQRRRRCAKLCIVANFSATAVARHLVAEALTDVIGPRVAQRAVLGRALSDVTLGGVAAVRIVPAITGAVVPGVGAIS